MVATAADGLSLPRATAGRVERMNGNLTPMGCPTCRDFVWILSVDPATSELYVECATCPPAPAVKLTRDHVAIALRRPS